MIRSDLCDYIDAYLHAKGTIEVSTTAAQGGASKNRNKKVTFKNCPPFIKCTSQINIAEVDDALDTDVVMHVYNLLEYSDIHSKTSGSLWQCYREEPTSDDNNCEISLMLTWSVTCFVVARTIANQEPKFTITYTKLYIPGVTLLTQDNVKLLK